MNANECIIKQTDADDSKQMLMNTGYLGWTQKGQMNADEIK